MRVVLQVTSVEIASRQDTVEELGTYVIKFKEMGYKVSKIWAKIPTTVHLVLLKRKALMKTLERVHSEATENSAHVRSRYSGSFVVIHGYIAAGSSCPNTPSGPTCGRGTSPSQAIEDFFPTFA